MTERDTYVEYMKLELDELNDRLDSFETKVVHTQQEARERYVFELAKLRRHSRDANAKLVELSASSEASWRQHASEMERKHGTYVHAFHEFKSRL